MIQVENIKFGYGNHVIFRNMSASFEAGKIYGLLGKNAEGKTTLLYLLSGLLRADKGLVAFKGKDMAKRLPSALEDIFIVPEEMIFPDVTLEEFVEANACFYPNFSQEVLDRCLKGFDLELDCSLGRLSMGTRKKVYICFALAAGTSLLLLDEPTNGLDIPSKSQFRKVLASCMTDSKTVIISTHQVRDVENIIDHIMVLNKKKIAFSQSVDDVCRRLSFQGGKARLLEDGQESGLDIEALFMAVIEGDEVVAEAFN